MFVSKKTPNIAVTAVSTTRTRNTIELCDVTALLQIVLVTQSKSHNTLAPYFTWSQSDNLIFQFCGKCVEGDSLKTMNLSGSVGHILFCYLILYSLMIISCSQWPTHLKSFLSTLIFVFVYTNLHCLRIYLVIL